MAEIALPNRSIGDGHDCYVIAEIGINHNGELETARRLLEAAAFAGCDAVKFQKRTPELCTPRDQWDIQRQTPWGTMSYIDYRHHVEFGIDEYSTIDRHCQDLGLDWFVSCWDEPSVDFIEQFDPPAYKVASASLTDLPLIDRVVSTGKPVILSTGMSTPSQAATAVQRLARGKGAIAHSTSTYPCPPSELNLRAITTFKEIFQELPVGYSGHEVGLQTTIAAVALGATFIERHITLDRAMWGSDQAASIEPMGFYRLVQGIRGVQAALGDGIKRVYESELGPMSKLRRVQ